MDRVFACLNLHDCVCQEAWDGDSENFLPSAGSFTSLAGFQKT